MRIQLRVFLIMALVAGVITQTPGPGAPLSRAAFAAPAGGDAVIVWNAHAGVAATNACIARHVISGLLTLVSLSHT
jgi:uncharacterized membrane protein YtjA (UPF0391 family)